MGKIKVVAIRDLGPQFVKNSHKMVGQDGAFSIPLKNNKTLWFFGDTLIGQRKPEESLWYVDGIAVGAKDMSGKGTIDKMLNNTGLILPDQDVEKELLDYQYILNSDGNLKTLLPLLKNENHDEIRVWCQHGVFLNGKIYLSFIKVKMIPQSDIVKESKDGLALPVNFDIIGSGLAVGDLDNWNFKRIFYNDTDILWKKHEPHFGSAIFPDYKEQKLYFYGVFMDNNSVQNCHVARVDFDKIEELDSYEYLISQKPEWSDDIKKAIPIFHGAPSEVSISFNSHLGCYLAVHSWITTKRIVARTAPNPWGPWSEETIIYEIKEKFEKIKYPRLIYAGKEHPELSKNNGKTIYLTYIEFEEYFPHLIEITFE